MDRPPASRRRIAAALGLAPALGLAASLPRIASAQGASGWPTKPIRILVGFPPGFGLRHHIDDSFRAVGADPHTRYEVPAGFAAIAELVANGLGPAFMPVSEAGKFRGLRTVALREPITWQVFLASPSATRMSPATVALVDLLLDSADRARGR